MVKYVTLAPTHLYPSQLPYKRVRYKAILLLSNVYGCRIYSISMDFIRVFRIRIRIRVSSKKSDVVCILMSEDKNEI